MKGSIVRYGNSYRVFYYTQGKRISKTFRSMRDAETFKAALVVRDSEGTLDPRDYMADEPLGFENCVKQFLHSKRLLKGVKKYGQRLRFAIDRWGQKNIKTITYYEIHSLLVELESDGLASKYRKDIRDTIKMFYRWLYQTGEIKHDQIPRFPTVRYSMSYRKIVNKRTQEKILSEVKRITAFNPRIYIGILFLATYLNTRPKEIIGIKERDIEIENKRILIRETKTGEPVYIPLLDDDVLFLREHIGGFPQLHFFRHIKGRGGNLSNTKFGKGYLYRWWKKACSNLSIEGVDLYGGCRHSSAIDLRRQGHSPEAVKRATGHRTSEAFNRYLELEASELRALYADTRTKIMRLENEKIKSYNNISMGI